MGRKETGRIVALSILLHLLALAVWNDAFFFNLSVRQPATPPAATPPIVFELQEPGQQPEQPREVIETPEDARIPAPPKQADFLSDKNARARNEETDLDVPLGTSPFSRGDYPSHDLNPTPPVPEKQTPPEPEQKGLDEKEKPDVEKPMETPGAGELSAALKDIAPARPKVPQPSPPSLPGVKHQDTESRVEDMGGLSFNTYNWNFAPYMLELKRRIQGNIFPPIAFTKLGIINGETELRFKIYPNGEMRDLHILSMQGHHSLMETSYNAVKFSAPFPRLPSDFPEPFLEVTGKFIYLIRR